MARAMRLDDSLNSDLYPPAVNAAAFNIIQDSALHDGDTMIEISLLSLLFGVLTVLPITSLYFFICRGSPAHTSVRVLVLSTVGFYMSTGTYIAALVWQRSQVHRLVSGATNGLFSLSYDGECEMAAFGNLMRKQSWMAVISLEMSVIIGDAIVWWRACVIWRNKVVIWIGPLLITLTLVSPDLPTVSGLVGSHELRIVETTRISLLEVYNPYIDAFGGLSLATNVLATSLIAFKAWQHRRLVKNYFAETGTKSQVFKALAFLVESGSVYCALLVFSIIYQSYARLVPSPSGSGLTFVKVSRYFVYGCLVPLFAIYPSIIVFLVALKRSPIDNGGLSSVHRLEAHGHGAGSATSREGRGTIIFCRSALYASDGVVDLEAEDASEGTLADDHGSTRSQKSSVCEVHAKVQLVGSVDVVQV